MNYSDIDTNELGKMDLWFVRKFYNKDLSFSENINNAIKQINIKHNLNLIEDIIFYSNNPIDMTKQVFKMPYPKEQRMLTHYFLTRVVGYFFELKVIDHYNLTASSNKEDVYDKIDAWDDKDNAYSITMKYKAHSLKWDKGNFEKMKQHPRTKKAYSIFIGFDNKIQVNEV